MNLFVLKNKAAGQTALLRHAHERSRMWIDHLFYNEQSGRKNSGTFRFEYPSAAPVATVSCASKRLLCRRLHGRSFGSQNSLSQMAK